MHFGTIPTACGVFYDALGIFTVRSGAKQHTKLECACVGGVLRATPDDQFKTVGHDGHALFKTSTDNRRRSTKKSNRTNTQVFQAPPGFHSLSPYNAVSAGTTYCLKRASYAALFTTSGSSPEDCR